MPYVTIQQIKAANKAAGCHFFDTDTMRFFDSRILPRVYAGKYFITSEQDHGSDGSSAPRKYTVRECTESGDIRTVGNFNNLSLSESRKVAKSLN